MASERARAAIGAERRVWIDPAPAEDAARTASPRLRRRDFGEHQDGAAARPQPARHEADRRCAVRPLGNADLHRRAALPRHHGALGDRQGDQPVGLRHLGRNPTRPDPCQGRRRHPRQPRRPQERTGRRMPQSRGAWFLFLPPYSPDLNPIEMAFAFGFHRVQQAANERRLACGLC